jgi:hypothetical protein
MCSFAALLLVAVALPASVASAQTEKQQRNYGSRLGARVQAQGDSEEENDRRTAKRINTRIETRLGARIDRFTVPTNDYSATFTPKLDDKTKKQ